MRRPPSRTRSTLRPFFRNCWAMPEACGRRSSSRASTRSSTCVKSFQSDFFTDFFKQLLCTCGLLMSCCSMLTDLNFTRSHQTPKAVLLASINACRQHPCALFAGLSCAWRIVVKDKLRPGLWAACDDVLLMCLLDIAGSMPFAFAVRPKLEYHCMLSSQKRLRPEG